MAEHLKREEGRTKDANWAISSAESIWGGVTQRKGGREMVELPLQGPQAPEFCILRVTICTVGVLYPLPENRAVYLQGGTVSSVEGVVASISTLDAAPTNALSYPRKRTTTRSQNLGTPHPRNQNYLSFA